MRGRCKNNRVWSRNLLALLVQLQQTLKNGQEKACRQSTHQYVHSSKCLEHQYTPPHPGRWSFTLRHQATRSVLAKISQVQCHLSFVESLKMYSFFWLWFSNSAVVWSYLQTQSSHNQTSHTQTSDIKREQYKISRGKACKVTIEIKAPKPYTAFFQIQFLHWWQHDFQQALFQGSTGQKLDWLKPPNSSVIIKVISNRFHASQIQQVYTKDGKLHNGGCGQQYALSCDGIISKVDRIDQTWPEGEK